MRLWKLCTGAPWRDIPEELRPWKIAYNRFNRWSKLVYWRNLLAYKKNLIRNEYSPTEVVYGDGATSMQVELCLVKIEQMNKAVLQRHTYPVLPMDIG